MKRDDRDGMISPTVLGALEAAERVGGAQAALRRAVGGVDGDAAAELSRTMAQLTTTCEQMLGPGAAEALAPARSVLDMTRATDAAMGNLRVQTSALEDIARAFGGADVLKGADIKRVLEQATGLAGAPGLAHQIEQLSQALRMEPPITALLAQLVGGVTVGPEEWAAFRSIHLPALDERVASAKGPNPILGILGEQSLGSTKEIERLATSIAEANRTLTLFGERSLGRIDWSAIEGEATAVAALRSTMDGFERSYGALLSSFAHAPVGVLSLPPTLTRLPAVEYFAHGELASGLWAQPEEDEERAQLREQVHEETADALDRLLAEVDPGLVEVRRGVVHALETRGPDWRRHSVGSLRELFGHVLRAKAPDGAVRAWSNDPKHYWQGRPTRAGRLRYLYRDIRLGEFEQFIDADVELTLTMMESLHKGAHEVSCDYTPGQVSLLLLRVEALLRLVLELDRY